MQVGTRRILDRSFSSVGIFAIVLMAVSLVILLQPVIIRGIGAFAFKGTVEFREMMLHQFGRGDEDRILKETEETELARRPVYDLVEAFEIELEGADSEFRSKYRSEFRDLKGRIEELLGSRWHGRGWRAPEKTLRADPLGQGGKEASRRFVRRRVRPLRSFEDGNEGIHPACR